MTPVAHVDTEAARVAHAARAGHRPGHGHYARPTPGAEATDARVGIGATPADGLTSDTQPATRRDVLAPAPPERLDDLGIPYEVVVELTLKVLYVRGSLPGRAVARHLCIPFRLAQPAIRALTDAGHLASAGMQRGTLEEGEEVSAAVTWLLTSSGEQRAREVMARNEYAGAVPVPIDQYTATAQLQAPDLEVAEEELRGALTHLVLPDDVFDALGPALNARHTIFLYGPPGNGKTSIADACSRLLGPPIFVPRALYAHGEVIRFLDPICHRPVDEADCAEHDERWTLVERPEVKVGGELAAHSLDLSFDRGSGFHDASAQLKANGGMFLVDDFGRQSKVSPTEILNRLIVPLEEGIDYINLARVGTTVRVPFTTTLILSTNLLPEELMDEALLRRVRFKVLVPGPTEDEYRDIWRALCEASSLEWKGDVIDALVEKQYTALRRPFRGVHPRDLLSHMASAARYRRRPLELTSELLDAACRAYFVQKVTDL